MLKSYFWAHIAVVYSLFVSTQGGCRLPESWSGRWFQLGAGKPILINGTHVDTKGECLESFQGKYVFHDRSDNCYRCIGMYEQHRNVLQYKETFCLPEQSSLDMLCNEINGDASLLSMFRVDATPVQCPFRSPPFSVVYSRGHGDCSVPPSRADACTVDTRMVLRYQACPDVMGTEAAVEVLECLATWKEGSFMYLVGRLHHKMAKTDEQRYRCFMYKKVEKHKYEVAQSGDATCSGLYSSSEGSTTIKLTKVESPQSRCKFPSWVTQHYHWHSLDYRHNYHFSHRNASLKISSSSGDVEAKLSCYSLVGESSNLAKLIIHVVSGCDGGYKCMTIHKRDPHVIQMYQTAMTPEPTEACNIALDDPQMNPDPVITLTTASLPTKKCPLDGKYAPSPIPQTGLVPVDECTHHTSLQSLFVGCSPSKDILEFQSTCKTPVLSTSYSCHGSWSDNTTTYVIGSPVNRHSTDARHYCFIFTQTGSGIVLKRVAETCATNSRPIEWSFNITETGKCSESSGASINRGILGPLALMTFVLCLANILR